MARYNFSDMRAFTKAIYGQRKPSVEVGIALKHYIYAKSKILGKSQFLKRRFARGEKVEILEIVFT